MKTKKIIILSALLMLCASPVFALSFEEKFACEVGKVGCPTAKTGATGPARPKSGNGVAKEMTRQEETLPCQLAQVNCPATSR